MKESEYNYLHSKILDLEKKFQTLQNLKDNQGSESKEIIENMLREYNSIKKELVEFQINLRELDKFYYNVNYQSKFFNSILESKEREASHFKSNIEFSSQIHKDLVNENTCLEEQQSLLLQNNKSLKNYITVQQKIIEENVLIGEIDDSKISSLKEEYLKRLEINNSLKIDIEKVNLEKELALKNCDGIKNERIALQKEIEDTSIKNLNLLEEKKTLEEKEKALENQLMNLESKISEAIVIINSRIFDIEDLNNNLKEITTQNIEKREKIEFISKENEKLKNEESKLLKDLELKNAQNLSEETSIQGLELTNENLSNSVYQKEKDIINLKNEIKKLQEMYDHLQDSKLGLSEEIDAVENHTRILEKQNIDVI